jgi:hypothetical protein
MVPGTERAIVVEKILVAIHGGAVEEEAIRCTRHEHDTNEEVRP